jgi:hypothetical protein
MPAIGPPPNPLFFEPLEAADVVDGAAEVEEAAIEAGEEVVSRPPSLVVVLSSTDTVYPLATAHPYPTDPPS